LAGDDPRVAPPGRQGCSSRASQFLILGRVVGQGSVVCGYGRCPHRLPRLS
jgi:hypothetical protein